jgi:autotransporter strand-loop-strand O-heptosyltransferase
MNRYDWIFQLSYDAEVDLNDWMERVYASDKPFITARWEHQPETMTGQLIASKTELLDKIMPRLETWKEFADLYGEDRFIPEKYVYKVLGDKIGYDNVDILDVEIGNRFNQVDEDLWDDDLYEVNFIGGPYFNLTGISTREYDVEYSVPGRNGLYTTKQKVGMWSRASIKYYMDWAIKAYFKGQLKFEHKMDLKGKNVLIQLGSKALGDTIAWIPYVDEFRKKHDCHIVCSGWWMEIFDYPEIEFVKPGSKVEDIYASYEVGCFDNQLDKNVHDWRLTPLQKVSADILGLEYEPIRAKMKYDSKPVIEEPYICFSEFSTMQNKFWNREGAWQKVINYLNSLGYKCVSISAEKSRLENIISHNGQLIDETIRDIAGAQFYVGLNAGPTWVAYALGIPAIMITGVSEEWNDFPNPYRVSVDVCRPGCFNDPSLPIDRGWNWCGRNKDFACTREITEELVIETINKLRQDNNLR